MAFEAGGREYISFMAGGHHFMHTPMGDDVIANALPEARPKSWSDATEETTRTMLTITASRLQRIQGCNGVVSV